MQWPTLDFASERVKSTTLLIFHEIGDRPQGTHNLESFRRTHRALAFQSQLDQLYYVVTDHPIFVLVLECFLNRMTVIPASRLFHWWYWTPDFWNICSWRFSAGIRSSWVWRSCSELETGYVLDRWADFEQGRVDAGYWIQFELHCGLLKFLPLSFIMAKHVNLVICI